MQTPRQHVILVTHTTLHLRACLAGFAMQTRRPDSLTLSCDVESKEILEVVRLATAEHSTLEVRVVQRAHTGRARCAQVRNNAVRMLLAAGEIQSKDERSRLIVLDGDTVPSVDLVARHAEIGDGEDGRRGHGRGLLLSTFRVNCTPEQTDGFSFERLQAGQDPIELTSSQRDDLATRETRYRRQAMWRTLRLGKDHKPRLIGGHFSVPAQAYVDVNGVDEQYEGYGQEDDDFGRRLHRAGWQTDVAVTRILAYHLYHPTRAPGNWHDAPGVKRFKFATPVRCERGVVNPMEQGSLRVWMCARGQATAIGLESGVLA